MDYRQAETSERGEVLDVLAAAYARSDEEDAVRAKRAYFADMLARDPWFETAHNWVGVVGGRIAVTLHVFGGSISVGERQLKRANIGAVATHPAHQGKRLASGLLRHVAAQLAMQGIDVSFIFGGHGLYRRLGWEPFPASRLVARLPPGIPVKAGPGRAEEARNADGIEVCIRLYEAHGRSGAPVTVRSPGYWRRHADWLVREPNHLLVVSVADNSVGYVRYRMVNEIPRLLEFVSVDGQHDSHVAGALVAACARDSLTEVHLGAVRSGHALIGDMRDAGCDVRLEENRGLLCRSLQERALSALFPEPEKIHMPAVYDHF